MAESERGKRLRQYSGRLAELGIAVEPGAGFFERIEDAERPPGLGDVGEPQRRVDFSVRLFSSLMYIGTKLGMEYFSVFNVSVAPLHHIKIFFNTVKTSSI